MVACTGGTGPVAFARFRAAALRLALDAKPCAHLGAHAFLTKES